MIKAFRGSLQLVFLCFLGLFDFHIQFVECVVLCLVHGICVAVLRVGDTQTAPAFSVFTLRQGYCSVFASLISGDNNG